MSLEWQLWFFWNYKNCLIKRNVAVLKVKGEFTPLPISALHSEITAWLSFKGWAWGFQWLYNKSKKQRVLGGTLNLPKPPGARIQLCWCIVFLLEQVFLWLTAINLLLLEWQFVATISFDFGKFVRRKANPHGLERRDLINLSRGDWEMWTVYGN